MVQHFITSFLKLFRSKVSASKAYSTNYRFHSCGRWIKFKLVSRSIWCVSVHRQTGSGISCQIPAVPDSSPISNPCNLPNKLIAFNWILKNVNVAAYKSIWKWYKRISGVCFLIRSVIAGKDNDGYGVFTVDQFSGLIRTKVVLDHEERAIYRLAVAATDGGTPPKETVRVLRVEVLDLNDNRPTFTSSSLVFKVNLHPPRCALTCPSSRRHIQEFFGDPHSWQFSYWNCINLQN